MKPIAIFRHSPGEGPGYFATFLEAHSIPWKAIQIDAGEPVPAAPDAYSGLCFMGGPMSVNDDLPWVAPALRLIRHAVDADVPVIGHCLGGQLMAKALGGTVGPNPVKEIGWGEVRAIDGAAARDWLGDTRSFLSFHWHGETFSIPENAEWIMSSRHCPHQGFVVGPHLAMQCHVEMTAAMIRLWSRAWEREVGPEPGPGVQGPQAMCEDLDARVAQLHRHADRLYARWIRGLKRD